MARNAGGSRFLGAYESERRQADARGIPANIMMSRVLLLVSTALLVLMGLVMVFSASTVEAISQGGGMFDYVRKQAVFAAVGAVLGLAASRFPFQIWRGPAFLAPWALCVLLLVAVFFFGDEALGATRWLRVGSMSVQPTEFAKIVFVMGAAKVFYEYATGISSQKRTFVQTSVLLIAPILFLFVTQSDLGSAVVIFIGVVAVLWVGEAPRFWFVILIAAACVVGVLAMSTGYRAARVAVWLNPWSDEYGTGYQIIRSFYAFSEGGLFGVGLGNSREKFLYLPEAETDYIFSIIGEELGLVGTLSVIVLFLVLLYAGLQIAAASPDGFGRMLAGGLTAMLVGQAFLNMACVIGLFPTTGKPLPFISSGGSSIIASLIMVGLIYGVSRGSNELTPHERRRNDLNVLRVEREDAAHAGAVVAGTQASERSRGSARGLSARGGAGVSSARDVMRGQDAHQERSRSGRGRDAHGSARGVGLDGISSEPLRAPQRERGRGGSARLRPSDINLATGNDRSYYDERARQRAGSRERERGRR